MPITFKAFFGGDCRRFKHPGALPGNPPTVGWLRHKIAVFPVAPGFRLSWKDEEGDLITIVDDADLHEAVLAHGGAAVRLTVTGDAAAAPVGSPALAPAAGSTPASTPAEAEAEQFVYVAQPGPEPAPEPERIAEPATAAAAAAAGADPEVQLLISDRLLAKSRGDYVTADRLQSELRRRGVSEAAMNPVPTGRAEREAEPAARTPEPEPEPEPEYEAAAEVEAEFEHKMAELVGKVVDAVSASGLFPPHVVELAAAQAPVLPQLFAGLPGMVPVHGRKPGPAEQQPRHRGLAVHHGVMCDRTGQMPLLGPRFHKLGEDYDLCAAEFAKLPLPEQALYEVLVWPGSPPISADEYAATEQTGPEAEPLQQPQPQPQPARGRPRGCRRSGCPAWAANVMAQRGEVLPEDTLEFGRFGPGVAQLQHFLIAHGLLEPEAIACRAGLFGPRTAHAVHRFQADANIAGARPGVFDAATRAMLLQTAAATASPPAVPARTPEPEPAAAPEPEPAAAPEPEPAAAPSLNPGWAKWARELGVLDSMGFEQSDELVALLEQSQGSLNIVISHLLQ